MQEGKAPAQDPVAVDVWGLGVTLYITLVGRFPFQVSSTAPEDKSNFYLLKEKACNLLLNVCDHKLGSES